MFLRNILNSTKYFHFLSIVSLLNVIKLHRTFRPIFHCDAKTLRLGRRVGQYPKCESFALGIPTCWYIKMLKFALPPTQLLKFALSPTQTPKVNMWNIGRNAEFLRFLAT